MTGDGLRESGEAVRPLLQAGASDLDAVLGSGLPADRTWLVTGVPGSRKMTPGKQLAFHYATAARSLIGSAAPALAPATDAGA